MTQYPVYNANKAMILMASLSITDTNTHTYRTNPFTISSGIASGIQILDAMKREPKPYTVAIYVQNTANQELSVGIIGNIDTTQTLLDYNLGTGTIAANSADILFVYMRGPNAFPSEEISLSLSYATAPTSGSVIAYAGFYGE